MSHQAIDNLMQAVVNRFAEGGETLRAVRKAIPGAIPGLHTRARARDASQFLGQFLDSIRGRARGMLRGPRSEKGSGHLLIPGSGSGAREGMLIAHQAVNAASFQPMNRRYVVSVEDLETLISEARHLASEEDAGTVHADLGGNLARTTGSGGEAT